MKHRSVAVGVLLAVALVSVPRAMQQAHDLVAAAENRLWLTCLDVLLSIPFNETPQQDTHAVCRAQNDMPASIRRVDVIERRSFVRKATPVESSGHTISRNTGAINFNHADIYQMQADLPAQAEIAAGHLLKGDDEQSQAAEKSLREDEFMAASTLEPNQHEVEALMPSRVAYNLDKNCVSRQQRIPVWLNGEVATPKTIGPIMRISNLADAIARSVVATRAAGINGKALKIEFKYTEGGKAPRRASQACPLPVNSDLLKERAIATLITRILSQA